MVTVPMDGRDGCHFCTFFGGCNRVLWIALSKTMPCYVVTSSVSKLQDVPDTLQHLLQVTCKTFLIRCNIFAR